MVENCDLLQVVKIPYREKRFLVILRSFFSTYDFFPGRGCLFPVSTLKKEYFNEKMSSLAGLTKTYSIFHKSADFGHIWLPNTNFKVDFLNVQAKIQITLGQFRGEGCWDHCVDF